MNIFFRPILSEIAPTASITGTATSAAISTALSACARLYPSDTAYETVNVANRKNVEVSMNLAPMVMSTAFQWCFRVSKSGTFASACCAFTFLKDGVSSTSRTPRARSKAGMARAIPT